MTVNKVDAANSFIARTDLSDTEQKIKERCMAAQETATKVRSEYEQTVQQFNAIRQQATEKELELLTAEKHLEALVDLIADLSTSSNKENEGDS